MASKFFAGGGSDSESSSEEEEYSLESGSEEESKADSESESESDEQDSDEDSSDEDSDEEGLGAARFLKSGASNFLKGGDSESEEEEERQQIKSARDKRFDELDGTVKQLTNALKINDWSQVSEHFNKAERLVPNLQKALGGRTPPMYIKIIADLDDAVKSTMDNQKGASAKKMNAVNQKGLNAVRQKVRKLSREDQYISDIEKYRKDPEAFMEDEPVVEAASTSKKPTRLADIPRQQVDDDEGGFEVVSGKRTFTPESVLKHLRVISGSRGKKSYDRNESLRTMERLLEASNTNYLKIRVLLELIASRLDTSSGNTLSIEAWSQACKEYTQLIDILLHNPNLAVVEEAEEIEDDRKVADTETLAILGSPVSLAERLSDTLSAVLVSLDAHGSEFLEVLREEPKSSGALLRATILVDVMRKERPELKYSQESLNRLLLKRLEHIYFRPTILVKQHEELIWSDIPDKFDSQVTPRALIQDPSKLIDTLCQYLYANSDGIIRARTMLCQCYWSALHDQYYHARDSLLMSHLSETIGSFDVSTQILYNRALVQIGMAAFRQGKIYEAQTTLQEICGSNRQKELLAQGVQMQRYSSISPEQEKLEKQRLLPFHMHINLELLEAIFLTSSMLLEIPLLAQLGSSPEARRKVISKTFRRLLEYNERSVFTGPPENTRDHVLQAAKALANGDWQLASDLTSKISVWKLLPQSESTVEMLEAKIKIEGVRTYLFTYAPYYDTLSISKLTEMFSLSQKEIQAIVSKMIASEELAAALDQVNHAIIFRKGVELSRLQVLALTLSDKASGLIESNEKTLEQRTQGTANAFERGGQTNRGGRGGARGGRGRGGFPGQRRGQGFTGGALGRAIQT